MSSEIEFKDQWDLESALKIAQHPTVDAKLWAEVIEWLLMYGPPEIKHLLLHASEIATNAEFPHLQPTNYTKEGNPVYDVKAISESLGLDEEETRKIIEKKEAIHKNRQFVDEKDLTKLQ